MLGLVVIFFASYNSLNSFTDLKILLSKKINYGDISTVVSSNPNDEIITNDAKEIHFVGDVMLARHVEYLMNKYGGNYPFEKITNINNKNNYLIGNFEASVPKKHQKTPNFQFRFSVNDKYLRNLAVFGFTHMSLANNHTFDFGKEGFENTKNKLVENGIESFGHPSVLSTSSVIFIENYNSNLAIIGIHTLFNPPTDDKLSEIINWTKGKSDLQIVYIHWGDEYELNQSVAQRNFAQKLAKMGIDIIIGHHPHVVQGIEKIDDTLVFYSLGNFIFDQYFNSAVREGILLTLSPHNNSWKLAINPVTSKSTQAQPSLMTSKDKEVFLADLAIRSTDNLRDEIKEGVITLNLPLATSSEIAIMTE